MYILTGKSWKKKFLDYYRASGEYRIEVKCFINLSEIGGLYSIYSGNWRKVLGYIKEFGVKPVVRKIRSRMRESSRNEKFFSFGIGYITESDAHSTFHVGQRVLFIAPCHPKCVQRIVLPEELVKPLDKSFLNKFEDNNLIIYFDETKNLTNQNNLSVLIGWSPYSGISIDKNLVKLAFNQLEDLLRCLDFQKAQKLVTPITEVCERSHHFKGNNDSSKLHAVFFGYGHYAKTVISPNINPRIRIAKVHEIDPCQISSRNRVPFAVDTAPIPRDDEHYDVYFIASYHHTHGPLATYALKKGCNVVVEKPPVTTWDQLEELLEAMKHAEGQLFLGFTRRYLIFNKYIKTDLRLHPKEPIYYHCILQMQKTGHLNWYNWPNSGSQIISNGCHWIDHFLYLNAWSPVIYYDALQVTNGDIICFAELENGSNFIMVLTLFGSQRLGYRETITLRSKEATVYINDLSTYLSEDSRGIIRRAHIKRPTVYDIMYQTISGKVAKAQSGEPIESLKSTASLMLQLEDRLRQKSRIKTLNF